MTLLRSFLITIVLVGFACPSQAARLSSRNQARQQAEHDCYDDVQRLCASEIPDEVRIAACMSANRSRLSAQCGQDFDHGL